MVVQPLLIGQDAGVPELPIPCGTPTTVVVGTDCIATVHARLARQMQGFLPIELRPPPIPIGAMEQSLQWHKYRTQDTGLVWLRGLLSKAVERMNAASA